MIAMIAKSNNLGGQTNLAINSLKDNSPAKPSPDAKTAQAHKLELDMGRLVSMTGVKDVPVFTDKSATITLQSETLLLSGQDLALKTLDIESGKLIITGKVYAIKYTSQASPTSLLKKIFK